MKNDLERQQSLTVPLSPASILVVDDTLANRTAFECLLRPLGYSVFVASSGEEALGLASRYRFATILLDVRMPGMDGVETATCLRRKPFCRSTPIIFISAHPETALDVSRSSVAGPTGCVFCPVDSEILVWKVRTSVDLCLKNERIEQRAESVWKEGELFRRLFDESAKIEPELRECGIRLQAVVLVDDEPGVLAALRRLFRDESFDILSTSDPQEAFEWIRTRHVGALLADDRMPGMSGTTLFHLAKAHSPSTARIMLTGHAGEKIILHAREQGLFQVFAKPWNDQELKRTIRERLRERELGGVSPAGPLSD